MANNTDWLNISQMTGGTGETALSLTALTNSSLQPKTATITARNTQYNVSDTTTVTIQGFQPTLTLSRSTLRFDSTGGTATFTVYSNTAWTINFPALVHSYSTSAGTGDTEVTVVLAPNPDMVSKVEVGTVQDIFGVNQLYLTVVQESFIVELSVTPDDDIVFANTGSSTSVTIDCNADWEIVCPNWVVPSVVSGGSGTTTVTFTANINGDTDRSGEIIVYAGSKSVTINAFQPFYVPDHLIVTPTAYTFPYSASSTVFVVDSYPEWSVEIVSTGSSNWGDDIAVEITMVIPNPNTTVNLGQLGAIVNGVRTTTTNYLFELPGTYKVLYPYAGKTSPLVSGNSYITEVVFSDPAEIVVDGAFEGCTNLSSVTFNNGLTYIGENAFKGCSNITDITFGTDLEEIGRNAFSGCSNLNNISIYAETAPYIYSNTFYGVASGGTLAYPQGSDYSSWLTVGQYRLGYYGWNDAEPFYAFSVTYNVTSTTEYTKLHMNRHSSFPVEYLILDDGTIIGDTTEYRFNRAGKRTVTYKLRESGVTIPGAYKIGKTGYSGYFQIESDSICEMHLSAGVSTLATAYGKSQDKITACSLGYDVQTINFYPGGGLLKKVEIPDSVTAISRASYGTGGLAGIYVLKENFINHSLLDEEANNYWGATIIDYETVDGLCIKDNNVVYVRPTGHSITIPATVTGLTKSAFQYNKNLYSVVFETDNPYITSFESGLFSGCTNLERVVLPANLSEIGDNCFYNCSALTSITVYASSTTIQQYTFGYVHSAGTLYYPAGTDYSSWMNTDRYYLGYYNWTSAAFEPDFGLQVRPVNNLTFPKTGGTSFITVFADNTNKNWVLNNPQGYPVCDIYPTTSNTYGGKRITVSCEDNASEQETATSKICNFSVSGQTVASLTIQQEPYDIILSPGSAGEYSTLGLNATGETISLTIESPYSWKLVADSPFITFSIESGQPGNYAVEATIAANDAGLYRENYIRLVNRNNNTPIKSLLCSQNCYESITLSGTYLNVGWIPDSGQTFISKFRPLNASAPLGFYASVPKVLCVNNTGTNGMKMEFRISKTSSYPAFSYDIPWQDITWETVTNGTNRFIWKTSSTAAAASLAGGPMIYNYTGTTYATYTRPGDIQIKDRVDVFNADKTLKHRYIPFADGDGYGCLYDVITKEYKYGNVRNNVIPNLFEI